MNLQALDYYFAAAEPHLASILATTAVTVAARLWTWAVDRRRGRQAAMRRGHPGIGTGRRRRQQGHGAGRVVKPGKGRRAA